MQAVKHLRGACVFGLFSVLLSKVEFLYGQENSICDVQISRGSARGFLVVLHCPNQELSAYPNATWEYKLSDDQPWKRVTNVAIHGHHKKTHFFLKGFLPDTLHYIRAFLTPLDMYTPMTRGWTCPRIPPPVQALTQVGAGPGWLNVRWRRPKEMCGSIIIYLVRYNVVDLPLGPQKVFGIMNTGGGYVGTYPSHPCSDSKFCVLLTDRVQPGRNHTVEVCTKRYDLNDLTVGDPQTITVLADSEVAESNGNVSAERGAEHVREHTEHARELTHKGVVLPLWILILVGGMPFISLLISCACLFTSFRKKSSLPSNKKDGPIHLEEMSSILNLSLTNIYDYPQLPLRKENSTLYRWKL